MCIIELLNTEVATGSVPKKDVPKNFAKFTGKRCRSLFFSSNVAGLGLQLYCQKEFDTGVFQ